MTLSEDFKAEAQIRDNKVYLNYESTERPLKVILNYSGNITYRNELTWDNTKQSRFIERVLLGLPLGKLYITRTDLEMYVVDSTQRLMSLFNYYRNELILHELSILNLLNNTTFDNVVPSRKKKFLRQSITLTELDENIDWDLRNNLYKLLNNEVKTNCI